MKYKVFFELFGRKMQMTVEAPDQQTAKMVVMNKIQFHEIREETKDAHESLFDFLDLFSGGKR